MPPIIQSADITARFPAARGRDAESLNSLAAAVESRIEKYLGSAINGENVEVFLEGGTRTLVLPRAARSLAGVRVYWTDGSGLEVEVDSSLFRLVAGQQLRRTDGRWPYGDYRVTYTAEDLTPQATDIALRLAGGRLSDDGLVLHQDGGYRERREPESYEKREARILSELPIMTLY